MFFRNILRKKVSLKQSFTKQHTKYKQFVCYVFPEYFAQKSFAKAELKLKAESYFCDCF